MITKDFDDAILMALEAHRLHMRKDEVTPYMAHILGVCSLTMEMGSNEDVWVAALLHDTIEDAGGDLMRQKIQERFGHKVAALVEEVTETDEDPKPPWKDRKVSYLAHLEKASDDAMIIALADKLHNSRSVERNLTEDVWQMFNAGFEDQVWWYESLEKIFQDHARKNTHLLVFVDEFSRVLDKILGRSMREQQK